MRAVGIVVRFLIALLVAIVVLPVCGRIFFTELGRIGWPQEGLWTLGGVGLSAAFVWWRRPNWFVHTTIHELAHAVVCCLLLVRVRNFQTSDGQGGKVIHDRTDPVRTTIIALAPYTLPLLLAPALILHRFADGTARSVLAGAAGFLYVHHLHGLYHNVRLNFLGSQGDLAKSGRLLSLVVIACALLAVSTWWLLELFTPR